LLGRGGAAILIGHLWPQTGRRGGVDAGLHEHEPCPALSLLLVEQLLLTCQFLGARLEQRQTTAKQDEGQHQGVRDDREHHALASRDGVSDHRLVLIPIVEIEMDQRCVAIGL
jgi:hypothetical protein